MADMQRARHRRRGRVDAVHLVPASRPDERIGVVGLPACHPLVLQTLQRRLLRYTRAGGGRRIGSGVSWSGHDLAS